MAQFLIVDDHADVREVFRQMIAMHGHLVAMAESAEIGWEQIQRSQPDVIVIDQHLPGMSGMELLQRIRRTLNLLEMKVVICSADDSERDAACSAGADAFWVKGSAGIFDEVAQLCERVK